MSTKLTTDLTASPYFGSFDPTKSYYRIGFKPAVAIQARELNDLQAMLQDQIDKFGRNIYKEGSIVEGCEFSYDNQTLFYVKVPDNYSNGNQMDVTGFVNNYVYNSNGLKGLVVAAQTGAYALAPNTNTLFVKWVNSGTYGNGAAQGTFDANDSITLATVANATLGTFLVASNATNANVGAPVGRAYGMHVNDGVVFHKGTFCYVVNQTVIVSPYTNQPDGLSVGFGSTETLVTADIDEDLNDNADGSPNFAAPGADRLKIVPYLLVKNTADIANDTSFFSLTDFKNGTVVTQKQLPEYSTLGIEFARRTYETNGNFVVKPFVLSTQPLANTTNATHVQLNVERGLGYVEGYRVEYLNRNTTTIRKATDTQAVSDQIVSANFGSYILVNQLSGTFLANSVVQVELHNIAKTSVSSGTYLSTGYSSSTKIGTAYVRGIAVDDQEQSVSATMWRLYLFGITMLPGQAFKDVRSVINYNSGVLGVADLVLEYNYTSNTDVATIKDPYINGMIFPFGQSAIKPDGFNNTQYQYQAKTSSTFLANGYSSISIGAAAGTGTEAFPYLGVMSSAEEQQFLVVPTAQGLSSNQTGNVSVNATSNTVTGTGTAFNTAYDVGDFIAVYTTATPELKMITSISNSTVMTVAGPFTTANTNTRHATGFPAGVPIPFSTKSGRSITVSSANAAAINLGQALQGTVNYDVYHRIQRSATVPITKQIKKTCYVKIDCSNNAAQQYGPWCLGVPDVFSIDEVYIGTGGAYSNSGTNVVESFTLDNGQRDTHYGLAYLKANKNLLSANSTLLVKLSHFTFDTSAGRGFFTAKSYPIDDANTANTVAITTAQIPQYVTSKGTVFDLRDSVDFRPFCSNTAVSSNTVGGASINPSSTMTFASTPYLPVPDSNFQTDLVFYMGRVDRASLDIAGNLVVAEGIPAAINPQGPPEQPGQMTLGLIAVPPYPSLSTPEARQYARYDLAITAKVLQNRRYTMRDIGVLDSRITNVEYYTLLNLLEQSAQSMLVRNNDTGQNRFRNGFFVDPFNGFDICNTNDANFNIAIDSGRSEIRPRFLQFRSDLEFDPDISTGCAKYGELIMLNHTANNLYISQNYASKYRNCIEGNVYEWTGSLTLDPPGTLSPDLTHSPDIVNSIDLAANWVNLGQSAWGTAWGNWVDTSNTSVSANTSSSTVTNPDGSKTTTSVTQTVSSAQQSRSGQQMNVTTQQNQYNLGTFVTNISILPYLKPAVIKFTVHGLKPNTRVYPFFANMAVAPFCAPRDSDFGFTGVAGETHSGIYGDPLWTDSTGALYGMFYLPPNTFRAQENEFLICDVSDLSQGGDAITTKASAVFYGSKLSFSTASSILNTREAVLSLSEISQTRTLLGSNTTIVSYTVPPPYTPPQPPYWNGGGYGTGTSSDSDSSADGCACADGGDE